MRCDVALLRDNGVEERDLFLRLSERETAALAGVPRPEVRRRRAAGRLAAKHLLLRCDGETARAPFVSLDTARLLALPAERYCEVEVMREDGERAPRATRCGELLPARLSIAHSAGLSCAAVASGDEAIGVDLETVAARTSAFYRVNFTAEERAWVAAAGEGALGTDWLYIFLWTVKEAALKSGAAGVRSVWEFPTVAVETPPDLAALLATCIGGELGERFSSCDLAVTVDDRRTRGRVETTATSTTILTTFRVATSAPTAAPTALEATS